MIKLEEGTEETSNIIDSWFKDATKVTPNTIGSFVKSLLVNYEHDYGTICHAVAAAAIAASWAINSDKGSGGITGFQAGEIMWIYIKRWLYKEGPLQLVDFEQMLYPQYEHTFNKTIDSSIADWLKKSAEDKLKSDNDKKCKARPEVRSHWERMARGWIPFGYTITKD